MLCCCISLPILAHKPKIKMALFIVLGIRRYEEARRHGTRNYQYRYLETHQEELDKRQEEHDKRQE